MRTRTHLLNLLLIASAAASMLIAGVCYADPFFFSTGNPDGKIATASRPESAGKFEIESADDFALVKDTKLTQATFVGLLTSTGASVPTIGQIVVEIYRVFPFDSDVSRTSGPPTFSTPQVPTRVNSPSDDAFATRDSGVPGELTVTTVGMGSFTASNSVTPGGINPLPSIFTMGNGPVTGTEVAFTITFTDAFLLPADHYFFVPQVEVNGGEFLWLSAPRPIVAPGTPFPPGFTDLQSWTRDAGLDPDWLRIGTDITHQGPFNAVFSITGVTIPEPGTLLLVAGGLLAMGWRRRRVQ